MLLIDTARKQLAGAGIEPSQATRAQISKVCSVTDNKAKAIQRHLRKGVSSSGEQSTSGEQHTVQGDTWEISLPKTDIHTLEQLLDYAKVDLKIWTVDRFIVNKWEMGSVDAAGKPQTTPLYQVKAWLKRNSTIVAIRDEIESLQAEAKKAARVYPAIKRNKPKGEQVLLEISIPDLHLGMQAWGVETNDDNYDIKIAENVFEDAVDSLLTRTSGYSPSRILFVVGNDLLHADTRQGTTERGTPVDTDGRYHKYFVVARKMITRAIEKMRLIAPVDVLVVPGNHDTLGSWHLGHSLECVFEKCSDVTINNTPNFRKYYQWDQVMLMFTHGNKGKAPDYPLVMATEASEMWGKTQFREAHVGHIHTQRVNEHHGVKVRVSPSLAARDAWHSESQFTGNQRCAEALLWSGTRGLLGTCLYTVPKSLCCQVGA